MSDKKQKRRVTSSFGKIGIAMKPSSILVVDDEPDITSLLASC
jgi:hypothetical protein